MSYLDFIVLAETKLTPELKTETLESILTNWKILGRFDSPDQRKHMLLLASRRSNFSDELTITYQTAKRDGNIQIEGMVVKLECDIQFGFVYCRSTPTSSDIRTITKCFGECNVLMGDLNLSQRIKADQPPIKHPGSF